MSFGVDYSQVSKGGQLHVIDSPRGPFKHPPAAPSGGGGLVSTLGDYWRFAEMLRQKGALSASKERLLGRKTVELMAQNHVPLSIMPLDIGGVTLLGHGFGLGVSVLINMAEALTLGSVGSFGWSGAAMTNFWIDPSEDLVGIFMTQFMPSDFYQIQKEFRVLSYQAMV
ncbi:MAG: serine hydrolase domain-containing protein [Deinococcales bacterium]